MASRLNLAPNPSFRLGAQYYNPINGATSAVVAGSAFYGNEALLISKAAQNNSGVETDPIPVVAGLSYAYSMYVSVPNTVPAQDASGLVLKVSWFNVLDKFISDSTSAVVSTTDRSGWTRLTGVDQAPATAVTARISVTQLAAGRARQTFMADALLFEQSSYVGGYLDNVGQAEETAIVNSGLSPKVLPPIGGLQLDADIILGDLVLNTVDENNVVWVCTDISGWYGQSEPSSVDIPRGVEDGSYDVTGRYQARVLTVQGSFLLPDPALLGAARDRLVAATNLVRKGVWLRTNENPTRAAFVRLSGKPKIETVNAKGRTDFSIGLKAADPIRYAWNDEDPQGLNTETIQLSPVYTNLVRNPSFEVGGTTVVATQNAVYNPRALGSTISYGSLIETDPITGLSAFKFSPSGVAYETTQIRTAERPSASLGQRWWSRVKVRRNENVFGARRISSKIVFRDSSGNVVSHQRAPYGDTGVTYRWTGAPYASTSERYENGVRRINLAVDPTSGGRNGMWGTYYSPARSFEVTDAPHGNSAYVITTSSTGTADNPQGMVVQSVTGDYRGLYVTASVMVRGAAGQQINIAGRTSNNEGQDAQLITLTGGWDRVAVRYRAPSDVAVTSVGIQAHSGFRPAGYVGQRFQFNGMIIETDPVASPAVDFFYAGRPSTTTAISDELTLDTVPDGTFYRWTGTSGNSTSERYEGTTRRTNVVTNPSAEGTNVSFQGESNTAIALVADTMAPGSRAYRLTHIDTPYSSAKLSLSDQGAATAGQRWWARFKLHQASTNFGARRISARLAFRDSSGNLLAHSQKLIGDQTGVVFRWVGTPYNSMSERIDATTRRVNMFSDPHLATAKAYSRWFGGGSGAGTHLLLSNSGIAAADGPDIFLRKLWNGAANTNGDTGFEPEGARITVVAGQPYTISAFMRTSSTGKQVGARFGFYNSSNTLISSTFSTLTTLNTNEWALISGTMVAPAGATSLQPLLDVTAVGTAWVVGESLDIAGAMVEATDTRGDFFSGLTPNVGAVYSPDQSFDYIPPGVFTRWTGTAYLSSSERYEGKSKRVNEMPTPSFESGLGGWNGARANELSTGSGRAQVVASADYGSGAAFATSASMPGVAGDLIFARAVFTNAAASQRQYRLQITAYSSTDGTGSSIGNSTSSNTIIASGATGEITMDRYPLPANAQSYRLVLVTSGDTLKSGDIVFFDDVLVEKNSRGTYFDGATTNTGVGNLQRIGDYVVAADAPLGTAYADLIVYRDPIYNQTANDIEFVDSVMLTQNPSSTAPDYFDGDSVGLSGGVLHRWVRAANSSASQRFEGNTVRTNDVVDPEFTTPASWYRNTTKANYTFNGDGTVSVTATANFIAGELVLYTSLALPGFEGDTKGSRIKVSNTGTTDVTLYGNIRGYSQFGATNDASNSDDLLIPAGATLELVFPPITLVTGSTGYRPLVRVRSIPSGASLVFSEHIAENVADSNSAPGKYFDALTASTPIYATGIAPAVQDYILTSTAPDTAASADLLVYREPSFAASPGDSLRLTDVLLAQSNVNTALPYFDGDTKPVSSDADLNVSWSGAQNNSPSNYGYIGSRDFSGQNAFVFQSSAWAVNGGSSLRIRSNTASAGTAYAELLGSVGTLKAGTTYTASIIVHRETASTQTATLSYLGYQGQNLLLTRVSEIAKARGEQVISLTFTTPLTSDSHSLRLYSNETTTGPDLWVDNFILTEGDQVVDYFDGTTDNTPDALYSWSGAANASTSVRRPGPIMIGNLTNIGTADVTATFDIIGPLGAGSTIQNSLTGEQITTVNELRGKGGTAAITSKQILNGVVTLTTSAPHNLVVGDKVIVSGAGSPFDAVNETITVTGVTNLQPYTFNYLRTWPDIDAQASSGQVGLADNDTLSVDTYQHSVALNGDVVGNRSRVETLIDWIKLAPGQNIISFVDNPSTKSVRSKSLTSNVATIQTDNAHFFVPGEQVYINLPTDATLAKKSLTSNVVTLTTNAPHGFSRGDSINVTSTETSTITNKALTSNVATLTTASLGAFNTGDIIVVDMSVRQSITAKSASGGLATITTAVAHGYSVGDSVNISLTSTASIISKSLLNNVATINTPTAHGFSVGDTISVTLPTTTAVIRKYTSGQSVILTTSSVHGFSLGDKVTVSLPVTATLTNSRSMAGAPTYLVTLNTTTAHGFVVGDRINVSTGLAGSAAVGYDGMQVIETVPSSTSFTFLYYNQTGASSNTSTATGTVTNVTNANINGTYSISSVPSTTEFSYNV